MARKTSKKTVEKIVEQEVGISCDQTCEINKLASDDEQWKLCQEEVKTLKKQNAGLRGEITRLTKLLLNNESEIANLRQACKDYQAKFLDCNERLDRYLNLPWYKRLFS